MKDKKETAVRWLVQRIIDRQNGVINEFPVYSLDQIFDHALKKEKQQIIDAFVGHDSDTEDNLEVAEHYYTETYGGQSND